MSSEAIAWAFKVNLKPSALKFTLVALCECANYKTGHIHPSIAHLEEITGQDRKTLIANISKLEQLGLLVDTGERSGRTGQIKVYRATTETVPKTEQYQKRNSTVFPSKQSQKRYTEPSREPSVDKANALPTKRAKACRKPDGVSDDLWADWLSHRDGKFSQTALAGFEREAAKAGWTVAEAFTEAIERKWQGFKADWVKEKQNGRNHDNQSGGRTLNAAASVIARLGGTGMAASGSGGPSGGYANGDPIVDTLPGPLLSIGHDTGRP